MAATIHDSPPTRLVAGDGYIWTSTPASFGDVVGIKYSIKNSSDPGLAMLVVGTDEGDRFQFDLTGSHTEDLPPGQYVFTEIVAYSWGRDTGTGVFCEIVSNPERDVEKSHNRKMVDLLRAHIEGRMPEGIESTTVGNVPISKITIPEATQLLRDYEARLREEEKKAAQVVDPNRGSGNICLGYFTNK